LRVEATGGTPILSSLSIDVDRGEVLGVVGESGSGKTTLALACLGYARPGTQIVAGSITVAGEELVGRSDRELRGLRGQLVSYVPQDPAGALNPTSRVGDLIREVIRVHLPRRNADDEARQMLARVHLPSDREFQRRFPHQLSGGQQQRVAIALALVCNPQLVVMDEPTTGLDVVTQSHILREVERLRSELNIAIIYVSHDLAVVSNLADRVAVMYGGWILEEGPTSTILASPRHPYTRGLLAATPDLVTARPFKGIPGVAIGAGELATCPFAPRCPQRCERGDLEMPAVTLVGESHNVRCFEWQRTPSHRLEATTDPLDTPTAASTLLDVDALSAGYRTRSGVVVAAQDVSFSIQVGGSLALLGESGSGKTTIARCVAGLHMPSSGTVKLLGERLPPLAKDRARDARRRIQFVFQNPFDSLNPRHEVGDAIAFSARLLRKMNRSEARAEALDLLEQVRLSRSLYSRYPNELSGGERQRVAIARALAAKPDLLICDEITSALDVSVQAAVLELIEDLRRELGLALLFISHDLGVVTSVAEYALVLQHGVVREQGAVSALAAGATHEYTRSLIDSAPRLAAAR